MIMAELVVMMKLVMVLTSLVPMGMWLICWRAEKLGIWNDIAGGYQVDEMVMNMMVIDMA